MLRTTASAILLVGHGTRSERGQSQFLSLAEEVRRRLDQPLERAFLELAEPTIEQALARLLARPIDRLIVAPLLLFAAGHAKEDIPTAVAGALRRLGRAEVPLTQTEPFGCEQPIVELAHQRLLEALAGRAQVPHDQTLLVVVGRGSSDVTATSEMHKFAARLCRRANFENVRVAFLAKAEPTLDQILVGDGLPQFQRIIIQPHLLFHGELVERLRRQVGEIAAERPTQEWIVTGVLADAFPGSGGTGDQLAAATVMRLDQALIETTGDPYSVHSPPR